MIQQFCFFLLLFISLTENRLVAQDQLFLRNDDGVLDCYIISVTDSIILFRTLDPSDKHEYEIPYADTYGFLLEDAGRFQTLNDNTNRFRLSFYHEKKRRRPYFQVDKGMIFRLRNDTTLLPRRGKITAITKDSIQLEMKRKRVVERINFAIQDIEMFGYTTKWTQIATLVMIPSSSLKEGSLQFYRQLSLDKGWKWEVKAAPEQEIPYSKMKKKFRPGQLLKLPKSVRKKNLRDK
ncbi:MAG TPA: hypothetical protein PL185_01835 [Flavobacteriales bacterium]|nr:hypothetical protein [Flavobacteriales bacterium]